MTAVHIDLRKPGRYGTDPAAGALVFTPTARRTDGPAVVLPAPFEEPLLLGEAVVELAASDGWAWHVVERVRGGLRERWVTVPDTDEVVEYADLEPVDPGTLSPLDPLPPSAVEVLGAAAQAAADATNAASAADSARAAAVAAASSVPLGGVPITNFLQPGETLDTSTSVVDIAWLYDRAARALNVSAGPVQLLVPAGRFRAETALKPYPRVGILGAGRDRTTFYSAVNACFMLGDVSDPWGGTFTDDVHLADFTVDCSPQAWGSYTGNLKAFYAQNLRRWRFDRVDAVGSWASMYGVDFLVDVVLNDCVGRGSGRGGPPTPAGTGSTFAFGVGRHAGESVTLINCRAYDAAAGGYFFEKLEARGATRQDGIFRIIGGVAQDCGIGIVDCGAGSIDAPDIRIDGAKYAGWYIGAGGQSSVGGVNGRVGGTIRGTLAGHSEGGVGGGHGVQIGTSGPAAGGYRISARIEGNAGSPIYAGAGHQLSDGGLHVVGAQLDGAIVLRAGVTDASGVQVEGCRIKLPAGGPAIDVTTGLTAPRIVGNDVVGADSLLRVDASRPLADPVIRDNTVPGASALATGGTVAGARVGGNTLSVTPPGSLFYDSLRSVAGTVAGLGDGWAATAGTGLTALGWVRTPTGGRPDGLGHAAQHRDVGTSGVRVSAIVEASSTTNARRRGVQLHVNPTTALAVIAEAEVGGGNVYRLIRQGSTGTRTTLWSSTVSALEQHEVGLSRPEGSTVTTMWIDGVPVYTVDVPQVPPTAYAGLVGYNGGSSASTVKIRDFTVRATI